MSTTKVCQSNEIKKGRGKNFKIEDYLGKKFGRLTIIQKSDPYIRGNGYGEIKVNAQCECDGNIKSYKFSGIKNGRTKSCGCYRCDLTKEANTTHGKSVNGKMTTEYQTWCNIKGRTTNPNIKAYKDYGERGIKMCSEWLNSFEIFFADMGNRPSNRHTIDRIDNSKGYLKSNCKWSDRHHQNANRRNNNETVGVSFDKRSKKWHAYLVVNNIRVLSRCYKTEQEAIQARKAAEIKYKIYE